ncbi:SDR family oxidoreductase [Streptomyces prunicolor]|uniref:SDR family oxidoreductase n=1 Tax=Streptomyces prunicolor TaxID=67348 RepID=UPI00386B062C|nr:SDR family oxidoreductase [Streptomyces prunicolor]
MPTHPENPKNLEITASSRNPTEPPHPARPARPQTVLLTGASGVLGTALLPYLRQRHHHVIALTHRRPLSSGAEILAGDVTRPRLGLDAASYRRLCARTDAVVHAAGMVAFGSGRASMHEVNVEGAGRVARFAADAGVPMIHVSTAYVARYREILAAGGNRAERAGNSPADYVASKTAGEEAVAAAGGKVTVVRPSIIIGDSVTGEIAEPQGLHIFAQQVLRNRLPFVPSAPASYVDFVPQDVVARAIVSLLDDGAHPAEHWLSGGAHALTCERLVQVIVEEAADAGIAVRPLRVLAPDVVERLVRPAFFDVVPEWAQTRLDRLLDMSSVLFNEKPLPSSLAGVPGIGAAAGVQANEDAWRASVRRLITDRLGARASA